jgi:hypothetical protein
MTTYEDRLSMLDARRRCFADNGFDGTYSERWVRLKAGPIRLVFPNAAGRVRAVKRTICTTSSPATKRRGLAKPRSAHGRSPAAAGALPGVAAQPAGVQHRGRSSRRAPFGAPSSAPPHQQSVPHRNGEPCGGLDRSVGEMRQSPPPRSAGGVAARSMVAFVGWVAASAALALAPLAAIASVLWIAVVGH